MRLTQSKKILLSSLSIFIVSLSVFLFFMEKGTSNMDFTHTNVLKTHSKTAPEEIVRSFEIDFEEESSPWFMTKIDGTFTDAGEAFENLISRDIEDLNGQKLSDFINIRDLPGLISMNAKLLQGNEKVDAVGPFRMLNDDDEEVLLMFNVYPIIGSDGNMESLVFSVKDITEQVVEMQNDMDDVKKIPRNKPYEAPTTEEVKEEEYSREKKKDKIKDFYPKIEKHEEFEDDRLMAGLR